MKVYFDMDGTIAGFYEVENWLHYLRNEEVNPYEKAKPLFNFSLFARLLNQVKRAGVEIAVLSWGSKEAIPEFQKEIELTKIEWLEKHLPSVVWDDIFVINYGVPKNNYCQSKQDILFDDEEHNRREWDGLAYEPKDIFRILKKIIKGVKTNG